MSCDVLQQLLKYIPVVINLFTLAVTPLDEHVAYPSHVYTNYTVLFIQAWSVEAKKILHDLMEQSFAKPFVEPVDLKQYPVSTIGLVVAVVMVKP